MKNLLPFLLFALVLIWLVPLSTISAQPTLQPIRSQSFERDGNKLVINFSIPNNLSYTYDIESADMYTEEKSLIPMYSISGDLKNLKAGERYALVWDVLEDREDLYGPVEARITLNYTANASATVEKDYFDKCRTVQDYQSYLNAYPTGRYRQQAYDQIETLTFKKCNTLTEYQNYLAKYGDKGQYAKDAKREIRNLERQTNRPYFTIGLTVAAGLPHALVTPDDGSIFLTEPSLDLSNITGVFPYAYDFAAFTELRMAKSLYLHLSGSIANRRLFYYSADTGLDEIRQLDLKSFRINPGLKYAGWFIGGYYTMQYNEAVIEDIPDVQLGGTYSTNILLDHPNFLLNDYGITIALENMPQKKRKNKDYSTRNFVFGLVYEHSLKGLFDKTYSNKGEVDPAFADTNPNIIPGVFFLRMGLRI